MKNKKINIFLAIYLRKILNKIFNILSTINIVISMFFVFILYNIWLAASWCTTVFCWWENWLQAVKENLPENIIRSESLIEVVMWYTSFFLPYAGLFAFLALVYAGFLYVTSPINEDWAKKAKTILNWVILWIILIFLSYSIVALFINIW